MNNYDNVNAKFIKIGMWKNGMLYENKGLKKDTAVLVMHSDADYLSFPAGKALASHGYTTLCSNVDHPISPLDKKLNDVKEAILYLKSIDYVKHIVILGHSGGATLMSLYQAVAENTESIFQDDNRIVKMAKVGSLPKADACMFIDSNFGNGAMTLMSIDPSVKDETSGINLDDEFNIFDPKNGFNGQDTHYNEEFKKKFFIAQAKRNNELISYALEREKELNNHEGLYLDDEPFIVPGANQMAPNNKLFPEDTSLLSHTKNKYDLLHGDGSVTHEIIHSLRKSRGDKNLTPLLNMGSMQSTIRTFISSNAVRTTENYSVTEDGIYGIDYDSSYSCTPGNIQYISSPILIMGMTAGYEYLASEILFEKAQSMDKTIAFVEGASHMLFPAKDCEKYEGEFGDTVKTIFDFAAKWLEKEFN